MLECHIYYFTAHYPWPPEEFLENPPHTPLNAIISGPTAGGSWGPGDDAPRSVSLRWWDVVCPAEERRILNTREVKPSVGWSQGNEIFEAWRKVLLEAPERCIEVVGAEEDSFAQTFDLWLWGSDRILSLWESFSTAPTSRLLGSSPIVSSAVDRNGYLFLPHGPRPPYPASANPYDRMLAMHLRRGDYKNHCIHLANWNSTFYRLVALFVTHSFLTKLTSSSWSQLPQLPDHFVGKPFEGLEYGHNSDENMALFMKHCIPTFDEIVQKVKDSKDDYIRAGVGKGEPVQRTLDVLYILTNEQSEWLDQLKDALRDDGWSTIRTTRDLILDQEQTDVGMAIDMDIARLAAVFIGNGVRKIMIPFSCFVLNCLTF